MGNPPPLSVDPEQLAAAGNELKYSASQLPAAPAPFGVVGSDPLTQAIDLQIPAIEDPIATQLPAVKAQATKTAQNVISAAEAYLTTDQQLGGQISQEMQNLPAAEGLSGGGGSAGGAAASAAGGRFGGVGGGRGRLDEPDDEHTDADGQPDVADADAGDEHGDVGSAGRDAGRPASGAAGAAGGRAIWRVRLVQPRVSASRRACGAGGRCGW